jgi:hypothetical protein
LNNGAWPDADSRRTGFDAERETFFRLMLLNTVQELEIHVSDDVVGQMAIQILRSLNRGNPLPLDVFEAQVLRPRGFSVTDFQRFIRDDLAIQQVINVTGLSGRLITPQEARELYEREYEERSVQAVFFSLSNHLDAVAATPEAVAQFYTNQLANYRVPDRVQISYVRFALSNYQAQANAELNADTNLAERIEATYQRYGTNYFSEAKSPEEAKAKIRDLMLNDRERLAARKDANALLTAVYDLEPHRAENLAAIAAKKRLTAEISEPFASGEPPAGLKVDAAFTRDAFKLTADEPFAGPLNGDDAVYVIAAHKTLPTEIPSLDSIRERVTTDFRLAAAMASARQEGENFYNRLTNGLAAGRSFAAMCAEAKLKPVLPPPLAPGTTAAPEVEAQVNLLLFKNVVFSTAVGGVSRFTPSQNGGFVVYVQSRLPIDEATMKANLPKFLDSIRAGFQNDAFQTWFRKEAEVSLANIPYFRQPPSLGGTPKK